MKKDAVMFSLLIFVLVAGVIGSDLLVHCRHDASCSSQLGLSGPSGDSSQEMALIKE